MIKDNTTFKVGNTNIYNAKRVPQDKALEGKVDILYQIFSTAKIIPIGIQNQWPSVKATASSVTRRSEIAS